MPIEEARAKAEEIEKKANEQSKAVKAATDNYIIDMLTKTENILAANLEAVRRAKGAILPSENNEVM